MSDPIGEYLNLIRSRLRTTPAEASRILAEAEDHLRQAVADGLAAGLTEREAQDAAISSFGSVNAVVRAHNARLWRHRPAALLGDLVLAAWKLGSIGLLAVGASGLVVEAMNRVFGHQFVGGTPAGWKVTAAECQRWLQLWPGVHSCAQAAVLENSSDAVSLRVAAGILGVVFLAVYVVFRMRRARPADVLPDGFVPAAAVSVFGAAAIGLTWLAVSADTPNPVIAGNGSGYYASGAIVSLAMAVAYLWPLRRRLLRHAPG
jgi:hypothetical protein